jgi:thermitase
MKKLVGLVAVLTMSLPTFAAQYLVKYRNAQSIQSFASTSNMQILDVHEAGKLMKVNIPKTTRFAAMVGLMSNPNVEYIVPNSRLHSFSGVPADVSAQALKQQWAVSKVQAEKAWQRAGNKGSKKVVVAVIDTGADSKHKSLSPNMVAGFDFAGNDSDPDDETGQNPGHGTHCAGVIGATGLTDGGTVGISPEVSVMPIRFLDANGGGDLDNAVKSIDYAIEKKVDIISASWGGAIPRPDAQPLIEAIQRAEKAGIIFVVAAGNDGQNNDTYEVFPANAGVSNMIVVAASDANDKKPSWSDYGTARVHVAAPGNEIMSTLPKDKYGNLSGTSMATPLVAGMVAFLKAQDSSLNAVQMRSLVQASGVQTAIQTACDCRVDAFQAVDTIKNKTMFVSPFGATIVKGETQAFEGVYGKAPFTFTSSNPSVATIDASGLLTAVSNGDTVVTVKDAAGATASSHKIYVGATASAPAEPPGGGLPGAPGGGGECPIADPAMCDVMCGIMPDAPWCKQ